MELLILLALLVPITLIASAIFCQIAAALLQDYSLLKPICLIFCGCVSATILAELYFSVTTGVLAFHHRWPIAHDRLHRFNVWLGPPAVACGAILVGLRAQFSDLVQDVVATSASWLACMIAFFMDVAVCEAIHRVDSYWN